METLNNKSTEKNEKVRNNALAGLGEKKTLSPLEIKYLNFKKRYTIDHK